VRSMRSNDPSLITLAGRSRPAIRTLGGAREATGGTTCAAENDQAFAQINPAAVTDCAGACRILTAYARTNHRWSAPLPRQTGRSRPLR
jgi:hypothetical protein